jgi:Fe-S-cluster containining protein
MHPASPDSTRPSTPAPGPAAPARTEHVVPCGSCQFCCRNEWVYLSAEAGDAIEIYETEEVFDPRRGIMAKALAHKPNGDCLYLGPQGCTIHAWRPSLCRIFDCRLYYLQEIAKPRRERRRDMETQFKARELFEIGRAMAEKYPVDPPKAR